MKPADRALHPVPLRLAVVEAPLPDRRAEHHLPVPIASALYLRIRHSWGATIADRNTLVGFLGQHGLLKQAWKLTQCGVTPATLARSKRERRRVFGCHVGYCPICARLRQNRIFSRMRPCIEGQMGEFGASAQLKLALPSSEGRVSERLGRLAKEVRSTTTTRGWRQRFSSDIGVVMTLEIGPGSDMLGHPHAHLFIYARTDHALEAFLGWLKVRWTRRVRTELIEGASLTLMGRDPDKWAPRLRYVLKGNPISPDWPLALVEEVIEAITSRKRLFSVWGLATRRGGWTRARFASNIQVFRPTALSGFRATG